MTWCNGLSLDDWLEDVATLDDFFDLHGFCHQWVMKHYQSGDEILIITALDGNYQFDHIVHCCLIRDEQFLDVRGETDSFDDVVEGFDDYNDDWSGDIVCKTLKEFQKKLRKLGVI